MKKSKFYDCCIFVALFIIGVSMIITVKIQLEMQHRINAAASQSPSTEIFTARNSVTSELEETKSVAETAESSVTVATTAKKAEKTEKAAKTEKSVAVTSEKTKPETTVGSTELDSVLVLNKNSKKIHSSSCSYAQNIKEENKAVISSAELQSYLDGGYTFCSRCNGYKG